MSMWVLGQVALGTMLLTAAAGHLTTKRGEFQTQVPSWFAVDPDKVVVASGIAELTIGSALLARWGQPARRLLGMAVAGFFVGIFPATSLSSWSARTAFGLDTDRKRALRLLGQPAACSGSPRWSPGRWPRPAKPRRLAARPARGECDK
jgi:uncharacterized membrane protein